MNHMTSEDRDPLIDLESGRITGEEATRHGPVSGNRKAKNLLNSAVGGLLGFNGSVGGECGVNSNSNLGEPSDVAAGNVEVLIGKNSGGEESGEHKALVEKKNVKEKRNKKKAPKPPRPPKGPSLDAADMKLVNEISALAMKKRARSERVKALRKMKEAKSSSSSSLSGSSLSAMIITIFFFLVILVQGFCSRGSSSVSFQGSPVPAVATNSLISVQFYGNPSADDGSRFGSESPSSVEQASGPKFSSPG